MVDGLITLMNSAREVTGPINLGNPAEYSVIELATEVQALIGGNVTIDYRPLPSDDPTRRRPDISRAQQVLGWGPVTPLSEGLKRTIEYFQQALAI
jgi:UDP-glucuronate decarboxylase